MKTSSVRLQIDGTLVDWNRVSDRPDDSYPARDSMDKAGDPMIVIPDVFFLVATLEASSNSMSCVLVDTQNNRVIVNETVSIHTSYEISERDLECAIRSEYV